MGISFVWQHFVSLAADAFLVTPSQHQVDHTTFETKKSIPKHSGMFTVIVQVST